MIDGHSSLTRDSSSSRNPGGPAEQTTGLGLRGTLVAVALGGYRDTRRRSRVTVDSDVA